MFHRDGPSFRELLRQALSSTEHGYDLLAPKFDRTPFKTPDEVLEVVAAWLSAGPPVRRALDICCGTGAAMCALVPLCEEEIVGVDFSEGMLEEARRKLGAIPARARHRLVHANVFSMPFGEEFDLAVSFGAFGHIERHDEARFVAAVRDVLLPGGRFVFATGRVPPPSSRAYWLSRGFNAAMRVRNALWSPPFVMYYLTFTLPEVGRLLEEAGFDVRVEGGLFPAPMSALELVVATKR